MTPTIMPDLQSKRPAASLVVMLDWAAEFGLISQQCLAGTRTTPAAIRIPAAEVSGQQELKAIANIVAALGDRPGLGLQAAARYPVTPDHVDHAADRAGSGRLGTAQPVPLNGRMRVPDTPGFGSS
jgi:hypothetical protein